MQKHNVSGFLLLELMAFITLSSMLLGGALIMLQRVTRNTKKVYVAYDTDVQSLFLYKQFARDFACLASQDYHTILKKEDSQKSQDNTSEKSIPTTWFSLYVPSEKKQTLCTGITTNAIQFYGTPAPYFVRFIYKIVFEKEAETYKILRKEVSATMSYSDVVKASENMQGYVCLLENIRSCKITLYDAIEKKEQESQKSKQKKQVYELQKSEQWGNAEKSIENSTDEKKEQYRAFPQVLQVAIAYHGKSYTWNYMIAPRQTLPQFTQKPTPQKANQSEHESQQTREDEARQEHNHINIAGEV